MASRLFHGHVTAEGHLQLDETERPTRERFYRSLVGKPVDIIIRTHQDRRSLDQNAYAHAVPFPMIAEEWGEDIETTKLLLLGECFGWRDTRDGHRIPMKPHTSGLTVEEFSHFIEWMVWWAAQPRNVCEHGFAIPLPGEVAA